VLFGWVYLLLGLRCGFGFVPDIYAQNLSNLSVLGMMVGLICALVVHLLPVVRDEQPKNGQDRHSAGRP